MYCSLGHIVPGSLKVHCRMDKESSSHLEDDLDGERIPDSSFIGENWVCVSVFLHLRWNQDSGRPKVLSSKLFRTKNPHSHSKAE